MEHQEELDWNFIPPSEPHQCQYKDCLSQEGVRCELWSEDSSLADQISYYCVEHCKEEGYCYGCGGFWAGVESFDFNNPSGLCENCLAEIAYDIGEADDFDDRGEDDYPCGMDEDVDFDDILEEL